MKFWRMFVLATLLAFGLALANCDGGDNGDENGKEDVVAGEDVPENNLTGDVEEPGEDAEGCTNECGPIGAQECVDGTNYQVCTAVGTCLAWGTPMPCLEGQTCNAATGQCEGGETCQNECANVGVKTCTKEGDKVLECQAGGNGCNVLVELETCTGGQTCQNGACAGGGTGDNDCIEIIKCSATCQTQQCVQGCAENATQAGIDAYNAMGMCVQNSCGQYANSGAGSQKCLVESCSAEWAGCVGPYGTNGCMAVLQCASGCGANGDCQLECILAGSEDAQLKLWDMQYCLETNCSQCGQDQNCYQQCAQQSCMNEVMACQGS
jgi:hypothetical protein